MNLGDKVRFWQLVQIIGTVTKQLPDGTFYVISRNGRHKLKPDKVEVLPPDFVDQGHGGARQGAGRKRAFDWLEAKKLHAAGRTISQLAAHYGVSVSAVGAALRST